MSETGKQDYRVIWPKHNEGEEVVKERSIPPTYGNDVCPIRNDFEFALCVCSTYKLYTKL